MSWPMHRAVWPIRPHLRPQARCRVFTESGVDADLLREFPDLVAELNTCPVDIWCGDGRPGRGWDGWENDWITLDEALALWTEGEA
jgi:hypothetical protein